MTDWKREIQKIAGWTFGDSPEMADHLAQETAQGKNLANCFLWTTDIPVPEVGERSFIKNSKGEPVCVVEVVGVQKLRFFEVDETFAAAEGYKNLQEWRQIHVEFFSRHSPEFDKDSLVVCQLFKLVHVF